MYPLGYGFWDYFCPEIRSLQGCKRGIWDLGCALSEIQRKTHLFYKLRLFKLRCLSLFFFFTLCEIKKKKERKKVPSRFRTQSPPLTPRVPARNNILAGSTAQEVKHFFRLVMTQLNTNSLWNRSRIAIGTLHWKRSAQLLETTKGTQSLNSW